MQLRVGLAGGGVLTEGSVHQPYTLVGRDESCDVTLSDPDVHPRHAWFQVIDGRVFAVDLGSRAGIKWPSGAGGSGWLEVGGPVQVGPFSVHLSAPVASSRTETRPPDPLRTDPNLADTLPAVQLDFRNGKRGKDRWRVNRRITLVGRAAGCKLHLNADDISAYHCGLVLTPDGLWVVDLSGRGVVVNGDRMRVAPLPPGAELWVERFLIGCSRPGGGAAVDRPTAVAPPLPLPPTIVTSVPALFPEDEVPIGGALFPESASGLPSSHIMCDAFRGPARPGPISAPILVSGPEPTPVSSAGRHSPAESPHRAVAAGRNLPADRTAVGDLLHQLAETHGQLFEQLQQSLWLMVQLCGHLDRMDATGIRHELLRIQELNGELVRFQAEMARTGLLQGSGGSGAEAPGRAGGQQSPSDPTDIPGVTPPPSTARTPDAADAISDWVEERIAHIQAERQTHWKRLVKLVADHREQPT